MYALGIGHGERGSFGHFEGGFRDTVDVEVLQSITDVTGGRTVLLEGELHRKGEDRIDEAVQSFSDELRKQYTLGYYPSHRAADFVTFRSGRSIALISFERGKDTLHSAIDARVFARSSR